MEVQNKLQKYEKLWKILFPVFLCLTFILLDILFRFIIRDNNATEFRVLSLTPSLFTLSYTIIFTTIIYFTPRKLGKFIYVFLTILFLILVFAQSIHLEILRRLFNINDFLLVGEGMAYISLIKDKISLPIILLILFIFILMGITCRLFKYKITSFQIRKVYLIVLLIVSAILFHFLAVFSLGPAISYEDNWDSWKNNRNIYNEFSEPNKTYFMTGTYEYTFRNIYVYIRTYFTNDYKESVQKIDNYFLSHQKEASNNEYTGIFEDKNVMVIFLESIDTFVITDEVMPNLNKIKNEGLNFTNHFSPMFGSGYTFASEFALNTGLYSPSIGRASHTYNGVNYKFSLPSLFKNKGYNVNSIHMNNASYYNRGIMHESLGYMNHYALSDMGYDYYDVIDDRYLVENDDIYNLMIDKEDKFMTFLTTYSAHVPYDNTNPLYDEETFNRFKTEDEELSYIKTYSSITDEFIGILLTRLEVDGLLDNTVLVFVSDHYDYGYTDIENLYSLKGVEEDNLLTKTPFIIYSKDLASKEITNVNGTVDVLPTLANMFNLEIDYTYLLGNDIFSNNPPKYVYFQDKSFFDGINYYDLNDSNINGQLLNDAMEKMKVNDAILNTNYYNLIK